MRGTVAERAVRLPWLVPTAPALVALATSDDPLNNLSIRSDPAAIALTLRFVFSSDPTQSIRLRPNGRARLLAFARKRLRNEMPQPNYEPDAIYGDAQRAANLARRLAILTNPDLGSAAEFLALLTSIGPLAVATVENDGMRDIRIRSRASEITRRLLRRWQLPDWCVATVGAATLSADTAESVGAHPKLAAILQIVAAWLKSTTVEPTSSAIIGLNAADVERIATERHEVELTKWEDPAVQPMMLDLLRCAERAYRRCRDDMVERLECEVERLHITLGDQQRSESDRLQARKLDSVAELAAGAGHEINTPLAIISGQAQYLLNLEEDAARRKPLQTIVHQARRVHEILTELMQFARPAKPNLQVLDLALVIQEVMAQCSDEANDRGLEIQTTLPSSLIAFADPRHVRTILQCLIRNSMEAAPAGGWIRVLGEVVDDELVIVIEDSGPGPSAGIVEHMFDPFYSGRPAGRGRGLGLATAWRLAREQGGDVRFQPSPDCPARFVIALPKAESIPEENRISA